MKQHDVSGVYQIKCGPTGKIYIGSSRGCYKRWTVHKRQLRGGVHVNRRLQRAREKHGDDALHFFIIEKCDVEALTDREQHYIDLLKPDYNIVLDVDSVSGPELLSRRAASLRARAASITACPRGHRYDATNTYINGCGKRICRSCNALRAAQVYANETPEQREIRRKNVSVIAAKPRHVEKRRVYALAHKAEKAAYDKARWARGHLIDGA